MCELSIVVPVYRCADSLGPLHERVTASLDPVVDDYELILVDDGDPSGAWAAIQELAERDPKVRGVAFTRNFGQHMAITAGLSRARGRFVAVMDCDLQDPPEYIPQLYDKALKGFDVVYTRRRRNTLPWHRRLASRVYSRVLSALAGVRVDRDYGALSVLSRRAVDDFLKLRERDRHYILILKWLGHRSTEVEYEQAERLHGKSSYSLKALLRVALSGIFFQSTRLLRWVVYLGLALAMAAFLVAAYFVAMRVRGSPPPGFTALAVFTLGVGGASIFSIGIVGLYVARVFDQVRARPLYVVGEDTDDRGRIVASPTGDVESESSAVSSNAEELRN